MWLTVGSLAWLSPLLGSAACWISFRTCPSGLYAYREFWAARRKCFDCNVESRRQLPLLPMTRMANELVTGLSLAHLGYNGAIFLSLPSLNIPPEKALLSIVLVGKLLGRPTLEAPQSPPANAASFSGVSRFSQPRTVCHLSIYLTCSNFNSPSTRPSVLSLGLP